MTRVAIYARYSCDKQSETSIEDQIRRGREVALRLGLIVDDNLIFTDSALSGMEESLHKRQGYHAFIKAWADNQFDVFIVDEFARISRDPVEQAIIMRKLDNNRRVRMVTSDGIDTKDADWQLRVGLQGILAQQEVRKIQHRVGRGMLGQLERGYMIATPPFGYDLKREFDPQGNRIGTLWVINEQEAAIVCQAYAKREAGQSMHQIAAWLNNSGVQCSRKALKADGGYWRPARVKNMLSNPIYHGEFVWHGSINHRKKAEAKGVPVDERIYARPGLRLVSDETWRRCNTKSHSRTGYGGGKHALAGIITCGHCAGTLVLTANQRCRSVYCAACTVAKSSNDEQDRLTGTVAVAGVQLLLTNALGHFLTPEFIEAFHSSLRLRLTGDNRQDIEVCKSRLSKLRASQDRLSRMLTDINDDDPVLTQRYQEIREKVDEAQLSLKKLEAGYVAVDARAIEAQLQADPANLLANLFTQDVAPERLRSLLARLFPSIILKTKTGRYTSIFSIRFAFGAALAMASSTEVIVDDGVELQFELKYTPDNRPTHKGSWSVNVRTGGRHPLQ